MANETIEILYRDAAVGGHVFYAIRVGQYHKEHFVKLLNGQPNGCTCKCQKFDACPHQEAVAQLEAEYQRH